LIAALVLATSCSTRIPVDDFPPEQARVVDPRLSNPEDLPPISFSLIETAHGSTLEALFFRGGGWFTGRRVSHTVALVRHPQGLLLIDTGLGEDIERQFAAEMPWALRLLMSFDEARSANSQLKAAGLDPTEVSDLLLTHLHWDHAGGIEDFPQAEVWHPQQGIDEAISTAEDESAFFLSQLDSPSIRWHPFLFDDEPYETFPVSKDFYGDGSIVLVPMPGHTETSLGIFLNLQDGRRFLFSGDTTWALEGFLRPSHKFKVARWLVDLDKEALAGTIVRVYRLLQRLPELTIVPTHDGRAQEGLAHFPAFEGTVYP